MNFKKINNFKIDDEIKRKIEKAFSGQLNFEEIFEVEQAINTLDKETYKLVLNEIFKSAKEENYPINKSEADIKIMGIGNRIGRFFKNIRYDFKSYKKNRIKILAEGDSWFEHLFIRETLDQLNKISNYAIYSLAFGGDWIGNYLEEQKYLKKLKEERPDYFLLSGGGNDLVGGSRLLELVKERSEVDTKFEKKDEILESVIKQAHGDEIAKKVVLGRKFFNGRFWTLLNIFTFQYLLIIRSVENEPTLSNVKIITQGYDYAVPSDKKNKKYLFRKFLGHGTWLYKPLLKRSISNAYEQEAIIVAMIYEFNEMLTYIAKNKTNLYYIDCRGVSNKNEWNDELHLYSSVYKKIATVIKLCIESDGKEKIWVVKKQFDTE